ncbi:hypothetical protein HPP92_010010 [Vanilla planifolia]|uniref:Uncharacterized protein n=1 Tax=Vanilla planifolia TaxID=51239 RepID=A0A835QY48_VANPL|nr:hypothetical protein HPP92_010010 [Vanilla planifolia]
MGQSLVLLRLASVTKLCEHCRWVCRKPLPDPLKNILEEGINLYILHKSRHGRAEPNKGSYAKDWVDWEKRLKEVIFRHADYLNSIQVPFEFAVKQVTEQLKDVIKGKVRTPDSRREGLATLSLLLSHCLCWTLDVC